MINFDRLVFGYTEFRISAEDTVRAADILLRGGISAKISDDGIIRVSSRYAQSVKGLFFEKLEFSVSESKGVFGMLKASGRRYGFLLALCFLIGIFLFFNGVVWDVRIEGASAEKEAQILSELAEAGLAVGTRWKNIDKSRVELDTLKISENISWLNINRRGSVAYVSVSEKLVFEEEVIPTGYANLVAARDCIIEEILVERGVAVVKAGETVRKGDLIISGVIPTELGGGAVYASGTVIGRYTDTLSVSVDSEGSRKRVLGRGLCELKFSFLNFSVNIFKRSGNFESDCDIIEEKSEFYSPNGKKLPIAVIRSFAVPYELERFTYSADELCAETARRLREQIAESTAGCDILRMRFFGDFTDIGYRMSAELLVSGAVGEVRKFELENK